MKPKPRKTSAPQLDPSPGPSAPPASSRSGALPTHAKGGSKRGRKCRGSDAVNTPLPTKDNDRRQRTQEATRTVEARKRLGITPERMRGVPVIRNILGHADGGMRTVIAALRLSDEPDAHKFLDKLDSVSASDQKRLTIEEICVAAGVDTKRLLGMAVEALVEDSRSAGAIVAAAYHPGVIRATAESAMTQEGYADRRLFLSGTGFLPAPKPGGVFVNIRNMQVVQDGETEEGNGVESRGCLDAEHELKKLHERLDGTRMLEQPKQVIDGKELLLGHQYRDELECIPSTPKPTS